MLSAVLFLLAGSLVAGGLLASLSSRSKGRSLVDRAARLCLPGALLFVLILLAGCMGAMLFSHFSYVHLAPWIAYWRGWDLYYGPDHGPIFNAIYPPLAAFVCMTEYDAALPLPMAFPPLSMARLLGEVLSERGLTQLRIAETEKYAHVTFFFNGGNEECAPGEERILIPSPKEVRTYDEKPAMSAPEVTDAVVERLEGRLFDFIVLNFANCDMVGHTGLFDAAVSAVETVDRCLGRVLKAAAEGGYRAIVTADHGNAELMTDPVTGQPHTAHTTNPVPFILVDESLVGRRLRPGGCLADVAPTILELFGMEKPQEMEGVSLLEPL